MRRLVMAGITTGLLVLTGLVMLSLSPTAEGPMMASRSAPSETITVVAPNGGETWAIGSTQTIQWTTTGSLGTVKIELSRDGGTTYEVLFASVPNGPTGGSQEWTVEGPASPDCQIKLTGFPNVEAAPPPTVTDTSNNEFTISQPSLTVQAPNGGETWTIGSTQTIQWTTTESIGTVKIELSRDDGLTYDVLFSSVANGPGGGSQAWTVTGSASTTCKIRLTGFPNVEAVPPPAVTDTSNAVFTISPPTVQITSTTVVPSTAGIGGSAQLQVTVTHSSSLAGQPITVAITRTATSSACVVTSPVGGEPQASQTQTGSSMGQLVFTFSLALGSIDDATACLGTATYQASVSASGAVDQTAPGTNQATLTLTPSAQIISTAFPHPDTTVGQTSPLGVQVKHSAGFALGSPITVRAQLTSQTDPGIVVTPTLVDQTLSTQTASTGTLSFSFNTTVGGDSTGGTVVFSSLFPFNPLEGFGGLAPTDPIDPCNINTAYIQSLYFTPDSVAAGQTTLTTLVVQVKYWSSQNGNLPVSLSPDSIPGCASVVRITPDYSLPIGPTGPGGSILTYSFAMNVSNGCTVESLLRYRASVQPATGVIGPFLPGVTFGSRTAELTLQAPPPPIVNLRATVLNPPVPGDGNATISGQQFTLQVEAINPNTGQRDTRYNGQVTVTLIEPTPIEGELPQPGSNTFRLSQGVGTIQTLIKVVPGISRARQVQLFGENANQVGVFINVWFNVTATVEFYRNCDGRLSYGATTACATTGLPPNSVFVALPSSTVPCNKIIRVRNLDTNILGSAPLKDRGPKITTDPYWNTSGVPQFPDRGIDLSDGFASQLGVTYGCDGTTPTGNANVIWRFN